MRAQEKLNNRFEQGLHICVGLDSDIGKIPKHLLNTDNPIFNFNKAIIEATSDIAAAYKLNLAFYESEGIRGLETLEKTLAVIPKDILTIGDAKRGDIGNTSKMYAKSLYELHKFDSVTLHPYMGFDSVKPFLDYKGKINIILALTSNPSNLDFEKQELQDGRFLFQSIVEKVKEWNQFKNCGIVFGATNPDELKNNVKNFGDLLILLPGVGSQGGTIEDVVKTFDSANNQNYLINVSRGIIYVDDSETFFESSRRKLLDYNEQVKYHSKK